MKNVMLKQGSVNFETSWFSLLWTCQRVVQVAENDRTALDMDSAFSKSSCGAEGTNTASSAVTSIQFLAIFRFKPHEALLASQDPKEAERRR